MPLDGLMGCQSADLLQGGEIDLGIYNRFQSSSGRLAIKMWC